MGGNKKQDISLISFTYPSGVAHAALPPFYSFPDKKQALFYTFFY